MDEQFVNELAVALRKVGTIHRVGEEWVSPTGEIPVGGVPYSGQMVTRATYPKLWAYAQEKGLVKTEAEWQTLSASGNVPYFSTGDGSTTFRMPKISGVMHGVYAFGAIVESGELDATTLATGLARVESDMTALMENVSRIEANSSVVTQRHESSGTLTNAQTVLKKLTGLTPYKPLFVYVVKTNEISGVITVSDMTNVIGEEASQFEVTPAFVSKVHCLQYHFIPTSTSVNMRLLCNTNSTTPCSYTVHVYQ